ncbi:hypothetical protein MMC12_006177 [Toensbergia leucococca]|nr:hypothetical protein [Toensbergia leucococca]
MAAIMRFHFMFFAVIFVVFVNNSVAFKFSMRNNDSPNEAYEEETIKTDLTALIRPSYNGQSDVYSQALQILTSLQGSPSCNRIAASTLLISCHGIEGTTSHNEASLDEIRSLYAAQLAVCELAGAGSIVPQQCKSLAPLNTAKLRQGSSGPTNKARRRLGDTGNVDSQQLSECLQSLESRPQWWTSYSNSRQNAVVMCRAARVDIEKDDLINLHKAMVETSSDVSAALSRVLKEAEDRTEQQRSFATALDVFQKKLLQDLEDSSVEANSYLGILVKGIESAFQTATSKVVSFIFDVETDLSGLSQNIQKSNNETLELGKKIGKIFQQVLLGSSELAASQTRHWDLSRTLVTELQSSLETMRETEIRDLLGVFGSIQSQLRLFNLDKSFEKLESKAEKFHASQTLQAETQARLHDQMQTEMQMARGLLAEVTSSAASLQSAIEDTSTKISQMATFSGITGSVLRWAWLGLMVTVVHQFNPQLAGYVALILGTLLLLIASRLPKMVNEMISEMLISLHISEHTMLILRALQVAAVFAVLVIIGSLYRCRKRNFAFSDRKIDLKSTLPSMGMDGDCSLQAPKVVRLKRLLGGCDE